ncbi:MAG TPA: zf-HC2 domain-containing protein [Pyrinomonadaceae bacterium]
MSRHLTDQELESYRVRRLPPRQLLSANAHLHNCDSCHERYGGDRSLADAFAFAQSFKAAGAEESHLPFEQLAAYVDDALRGEEHLTVAAHLEECARCEAQVRELEPLRALITGGSYPAPARRATFFEKLGSAWQAPAYRTAAQVASVALVVALLGWFLARSLRTDMADRQAHAPQPPQEQAQIKQETTSSGVGVEAPRPEGTQSQPTPDGEASPASSQPPPKAAPESSSTVLALEDGDTRVTLDERGRAGGLDSLSPAHQRLVTRVLTSARVETPPLPWEGDSKGDRLMGGSGDEVSFSLHSPVGKVVETTRPTLRWTPLEGATSYVVTVRDSTARTMITSAPLSSAEWSVPRPLRRGVIYSWKVLAVKGDEEFVSPPPTAPDAQFKVLEEAQAEELKRARQRAPRSRLLLGALYARAGLLDEAEREFRGLVEKNPRSRFARKLLRDVRARRR